MAKKARRPKAPKPTVDPNQPVPAVGMREPCPCGSGKRYKLCHGREARRSSTDIPARPFEGLPSEADWVALHAFVPAATTTLTLTGEHADRTVRLATVLPMAMPVQIAADGTVWVASQVQDPGCGDPSRDLAAAILAGLAADPEQGEPELPSATLDGPRLQDLLDPTAGLEVTVREGFEFWGDIMLDEQQRAAGELPQELAASIERVNEAVDPTARLASVDAAYWVADGDRRYLRWARPDDEDRLLDALARLHARGESALVDDSRLLGSFRSHGLTIAVWDLPSDSSAETLEDSAKQFAIRLDEALENDTQLTVEERGARNGLVSRQFTLR